MDEEDEEKLWQRFTRDIKPLARRRPRPPAAAAPKKPPAKPRAAPQPAERIAFDPKLKEILPAPSAGAPQLDRRTDDKLRKGKMTIEGRLDLHGLTQQAAHEALSRFLSDAYHAGKRCVLVITGKGLSKRQAAEWMEAPSGILKQRLPEWLNDPALRRFVLKHYTAQAAHGGGGAFYIYLKRKR